MSWLWGSHHVNIATAPVAGAVHLNQIESPSGVGSSGSRVAPTVDAMTSAGKPVISVASAKLSFGGGSAEPIAGQIRSTTPNRATKTTVRAMLPPAGWVLPVRDLDATVVPLHSGSSSANSSWGVGRSGDTGRSGPSLTARHAYRTRRPPRGRRIRSLWPFGRDREAHGTNVSRRTGGEQHPGPPFDGTFVARSTSGPRG